MLHTVHQGVALHAIAALVTHHYEDNVAGLTIAQLNEALSVDAWGHYRKWCKGKSTVCATSSTFSALRFGRDSWQSYPELASCYKGAMVKYMMFWAAAFLQSKLDETDTERNRLRAYTAWSLSRFQFLQESNGPWLTPEVSAEMCEAARTFLLFYQKLAVESRASCDKKCTKSSQSFIACCTLLWKWKGLVVTQGTTTFTRRKTLWSISERFALDVILPLCTLWAYTATGLW